MAKRFLFSMICIGMVLLIGCGEKYGDAIAVQKDFINLTRDYVDNLDKAGNAQKMASAMNDYADALEKLAPKIRKINKKYPELRDQEKQPEAFQETSKEHEETMRKFSATFMKTMPYMGDPDVRQAQKRISQAMQSMGEK